MLEYAIFLGCNIPARVPQYESSARAVLEKFGVGLVEIREFSCCGYPLKNVDRKAFVLSSAENMALAEARGLDLITLCKCGFGTLKEAQHLLKEDTDLKSEINRTLSKKGLRYEGHIRVKHLLSALFHDVGVDALKERITKPYQGLKIATHYGCHALRPSKITQFDDPVAPSLFDALVEVTGAKSLDWMNKLECCGAPLMGVNDGLSVTLMNKKIEGGKQSGAHFFCTACPYCQLQFDMVQSQVLSHKANGKPLPSVLFTQLLGISMGIDEESLGISMNKTDISGITGFQAKE
jgi:heterodisulfide reductase subunit B